MNFSEYSHKALLLAAALARCFDARLYVQHTIEPLPYPAGTGQLPPVVETETLFCGAREEMRRMLRSSQVELSSLTFLLNAGDVPARLFETILKDRIDLVVMGSRGHQGVGRLLGSYTESVIHASRCPVLSVTRNSKTSIGRDSRVTIDSILLATDFSPCSTFALATAILWAQRFDSRLTLFHCVEEKAGHGVIDIFPEYIPCFEKQLAKAWERLGALIPEDARQNISISCDVRHGNPREEILRVAGDKSADLIITGAHGTGKLSAPWGSVSSSVVRGGQVPVLVVNSLNQPGC